MRLILAALLTSLLAMPAHAAEVTGTATYLARIAPPPGSVFEATLADVSRADAPAVALGSARLDGREGPPYRFAIGYDPAAIDDRMTYAVRATLMRADGRLIFTSDTHHPVLTRGAGETVEIVMRMAQATGVDGPDPLFGPRWRLVAMGDAPVEAEGQREPPHIVFDPDGGLYGSVGCNRSRSSWPNAAYGAIRVGPAASPMMPCPEPAMRVEQAFHGMLERISGYRVEGDRLTLFAEGAPLAEFVAEPAE